MRMNDFLKQFIRVLSVILFMVCMNQNIVQAGSVTLSPPEVLANGGVQVTAQGSFDTCTTCDQYGNCTAYNSGAVYLKKDNPSFSYPECIKSGNGSATCTYIYDRSYLHGTHTFYAKTNDCNGSSTTSMDLTLDNTPIIGGISPAGNTLNAPFDITTHATFKPTLSEIKGNISVLLVNPSGTPIYLTSKSCTSEECDFSYQQVTGSLYDLNDGGPYKIKIRANGGGASIEQDGAEFSIDKTPTVSAIEPKGKTQSPLNIQGHATFKPTLSATKGSISAYLVYTSGTSTLIGSKSCATEECNYNYQDLTGNLYQLNPGSYQIKFRATGGGATSEIIEPFEVVEYVNNTDGSCENTPFTKHPINYATGNKFFRQQDLSIEGPGIPLLFTRYYNSQREEASAAGYGWSTSFSRHLAFPSSTTITLVHDWGSETTFKQNAQGVFVSITDEVKEITSVAGGFELTLPDGEKNYFDGSGVLTQIRDRQGNTQSLEYLNGRLAALEDNFGRRLEFMYDTNGKFVRLVSPVGDFEYVHDTAGNLIEADSPALTSRLYQYEDPNDAHNLTAIVDENNKVEATVTYDSHDRALTSELADGLDKVTVTYLANQTRTLTDSRNLSKTIELYIDANNIVRKKFESGPGCGSCPAGAGVAYTFDDRLRVTSATDALGRITSYTYDERGNKLTETEAVGTAEEQTTIYTYHPVYNLVASITKASVSNSGHSAATTFTYDTNGNLTGRTETGYSGTAVISATTTYGYNPLGQLISVDGPRTDVADTTVLSYYTNDPTEGLNRGQLHTMANALGHTVTFAQYNAFGKPEQVTDENGAIARYTYDDSGRLTGKTILGRTSSLGYDAAGNLTTVQLPGGRIITYTYTAADLLETISDNSGNSLAFAYDSEGNRIKEEVRDPADSLTRYVDFNYDDYNRLMKTIYPGGAFEERLYDAKGNLAQVTDPENRITRYQFDALDRMELLIEPGPTNTKISFNSDSGVTGVQDAGDKLTSYEYDDLGRQVSESSPDAGTTTYDYDSAGNLISQTDARGITVIYSYDALNRLITAQYPDATRNVFYTYDQGVSGIGRLTGSIDASGTTAYSYNGLGQLTSTERANTGMPAANLAYGYAPLTAELESVTYPSGLTVSYARDADGRIIAISAGGQEIVHNITYLPFGPVADYTIGSDSASILTVDRTFTERYQVSRIQAGTNLDYQYRYYADGSVWQIDGPPAPLVTDAVTDFVTAPGTNRLDYAIGAEPASYSYDSHGNITGDGTRTFIYDLSNRLTEVQANGETIATYEYDGAGRRVRKVVAGVAIYYHYGADDKLIAETDGSGNPLRDYIYLGNEPVAVKIYGAQPGIYYYINDHLGTPQVLVDSTGATVWQAAYLPFGKAQVQIGTITNNLRFPGQYYDDETGLHYNWHRYYDPGTGRYLIPDPIGLAGGINLYAYANADPINWIDPEGLSSKDMEDGPNPYELGQEFWIPRGGGITGGKLSPAPHARGPHSVYKRDPDTCKTSNYETYKPQTNPKNPNPWEKTLRYDGKGKSHYNKATGEDIETPHVHDPAAPGGVRKPNSSEIP